MTRFDDGGPKLWLVHRLLGHRRLHPEIYGPGSGYEPLPVQGAKAAHAVAFTRTGGLAVVVPRLTVGLDDGWDDTAVALPEGRWVDLLGGDPVDGGDSEVGRLVRRFPVAVLDRER